MNPELVEDVEILEQKESLDRVWRVNGMLAFVQKEKELIDKLQELEKLEQEFNQLINPEWFTSVDYIEKINKL